MNLLFGMQPWWPYGNALALALAAACIAGGAVMDSSIIVRLAQAAYERKEGRYANWGMLDDRERKEWCEIVRSAPSKALSLAIACARAYRQAEQDGTPRITRGKALHDLGLALDAALDAVPALEDDSSRAAGLQATAPGRERPSAPSEAEVERVADALLNCAAWSSFWSISEARVMARAALAAIGGAAKSEAGT